MKEILDVVNDRDEVIGKVAFEEVYKNRLAHRVVHVLILNSDGQLALQMMSKKKIHYPSMWGASAGGHVRAEESYEDAAMRKYEEELGTKTPLTMAFKDWYKDESGQIKSIVTFQTQYNGPFMLNEDEVEKVEFFSHHDIQNMIKKGEKFDPELLFILNKHFKF